MRKSKIEILTLNLRGLLQRQRFFIYEVLPGTAMKSLMERCLYHACLFQSKLLFLPNLRDNFFRDLTENPCLVCKGIEVVSSAYKLHGQKPFGAMLEEVLDMLCQSPTIVIEGGSGGGSDGRREQLLRFALWFQPFVRLYCAEKALALTVEIMNSGDAARIVKKFEVRYLPWDLQAPPPFGSVIFFFQCPPPSPPLPLSR